MKAFLNVDGNKLPTWGIVNFLLNVRTHMKAGVRKGVAIHLGSDILGTNPRIGRDIWEHRHIWLKQGRR